MAPKQSKMPVKGGVRRKRTSAARISDPTNDATTIKYRALGLTMASGAGVTAITNDRGYIPGAGGFFVNAAGPAAVSYYSTGKFLPGTTARWEPSVSFTTSGRVFVAFTDNVEAITNWFGLSTANRILAIKGMANMRSFPVWQETDIAVPLPSRRKMFDVNATWTGTTDILDRSAQTWMLIAIEGPENTSFGSFWYHDNVYVEGMHPITT